MKRRISNPVTGWVVRTWQEGALAPSTESGPYSTHDLALLSADIKRELIKARGWNIRVTVEER